MLRTLAVAAVVALVAVFAAGFIGIRAVVGRVERATNAQRVRRAEALLARQAEVRTLLVREYAWWTDTWDYIDHPGTPASTTFLKDNMLDWLPRQYGERYLAIWRADGRRVFEWADSGTGVLTPLIEQPDHLARVVQRKSVGGLVPVAGRLFVVSAAIVVRTEDQEATGPWHGYLATGQPLGAATLREWSGALQERIELRAATAGDAALLGDTAVSRPLRGDSVETAFLSRDVYGRPSIVVSVVGSRAWLTGPGQLTAMLLVAAALLGFALIAVVWAVARQSVWRPLSAVVAALRGMRASGQLSTIPQPGGSREWHAAIAAFNGTVEALQAAEEQYRTLFRLAADALLVVEGPDRTIADANPAAERLAGVARAELVGRPLGEFLGPLLEGGSTPGTQLWLRHGGAPATVEVVAGTLSAGPRRLTLVSVHDLTEREALEEQLRRSQRMEGMGRLAGGIAHDFNNVLAVVLMSASSLRDELGPGHAGQDLIGTIEHASRRAAELTAQLLSFARRAPVRREPLAIDELAANVRGLCERTFGHAVAIAGRLAGGRAAVMGDQAQLEQALLNLCLNARDAMPAGGTLGIHARVEAPGEGAPLPGDGPPGLVAVLEVADTGIGMPPEVLAHLFEPFFTTKERGKGTGLGLATAYGIVRAHGGVIRVASEPGRGSRFEIRLPATERPATAAPVSRLGLAPGGRETILVVDDEIGLRRTLGRALDRLGYRVEQAASGEEAVQRFAERPDEIALVLLDVLMPGIGGVAAFRELRRLRPDARIVVMTGYASGAELETLRAEGASAIMIKPFAIPEFAETIRAVLDGAETAAAP